MKKFILSFIALRTCWSVVEFLSLMICEKSVELLTKDITSIICVRVLFTLTYFIFTLVSKRVVPYFSNQLYVRKVLITSGAVVLLTICGQAYFPFWSYYVIIVIITSASLVFTPCVSYLLYKGVKLNDKSEVIRKIGILSSTMGIASYVIASIYVTDTAAIKDMLIIALLLIVLVYVLFSVCVKIWLSYDTRDHFILNQHQVNASASLNYNKPSWKLKDSIRLTGVLIIFSVYQLLYSSIDSMNTAYVHDVLKKGQETQFMFVGIFMAGIASISFHKSFIVSRIRTSYMLQNSLLFVAIYMFVLSQKASIWYLYGIMFLLGAMSGLILVAMNLAIHQNTTPALLSKRLMLYTLILNVGPVVSNSFLLVSFKYTKLEANQIAMWVAFICMGIISIIVIIRFFKPRTKDMTYSQYR
jgi:MFS family permease